MSAAGPALKDALRTTIGRRPLLLLIESQTNGLRDSHTDVTLWFVLIGDSTATLKPDPAEIHAVRWVRLDAAATWAPQSPDTAPGLPARRQAHRRVDAPRPAGVLMTDRHLSIVDLHLVVQRADSGRILLLRRANTGYGDGRLHLPSGHLEEGESITEGVIREAREETGIDVAPGDLRFLHVMHRAGEGGPDRIGFFFAAAAWTGEPYNAEPHKCSELVWAEPHDLPADTIAYPAAGIQRGRRGVACSTFGFSPDIDVVA
ncbi:NUDIX domain-containing protein [Actinoplanes sp. NPDC049118]|uniref:NUDIX hydrolase n=1 Tax=Actinoplanes sp. NPDC049118 TaxID=3155769 RepID=UPI0033E91CB6